MERTSFDDAAKKWAGKMTVGSGGKVTVGRNMNVLEDGKRFPRRRTQSQKNIDLRPERGYNKGGQ